jgi:hypothetical protein
MEELRGFKLSDLYERVNWDDSTFVEWLQGLKLLHTSRTCVCGEKMRLRGVKEGKQYPNWQCPAKKCRKEKGFLVDTFFEGMHLTFKEIFFILVLA